MAGYGELIEPGCTPGWVNLSRLESGVYILNLLADENPENRWILPLNQAIMKAFDALEDHLEHDAGDLPAALLTISQSPKFFRYARTRVRHNRSCTQLEDNHPCNTHCTGYRQFSLNGQTEHSDLVTHACLAATGSIPQAVIRSS